MKFPGDDKPDYWDFTYFSFMIGMMCAGVGRRGVIETRSAALVLAHSVFSFLFNAALLALTVNIAASAIKLQLPPALRAWAKQSEAEMPTSAVRSK